MASPLPALESDSFQSRYGGGKWDGINENGVYGVFGFRSGYDSFGSVLERVVIQVGDVEWVGWTFDAGEKGLFLRGGHWGEVDLRKG